MVAEVPSRRETTRTVREQSGGSRSKHLGKLIAVVFSFERHAANSIFVQLSLIDAANKSHQDSAFLNDPPGEYWVAASCAPSPIPWGVSDLSAIALYEFSPKRYLRTIQP
jgi:hypothetical protein